MQRLEVSGAVRLIYRSLGVKGLNGDKGPKTDSLRKRGGVCPFEFRESIKTGNYNDLQCLFFMCAIPVVCLNYKVR